MKTASARRLDAQNPTPETFLEEIHRIFESGTLRGAREVAGRGLELFPDHPELRRLHHALRPPQVRTVPGYRQPDRRDTFEWIRSHSEEYQGQWIAVLGSRLIAASPDLAAVLEVVKKSQLDAPPLLHFVD
jgi:Family of unknown function (DUF5678)